VTSPTPHSLYVTDPAILPVCDSQKIYAASTQQRQRLGSSIVAQTTAPEKLVAPEESVGVGLLIGTHEVPLPPGHICCTPIRNTHLDCNQTEKCA